MNSASTAEKKAAILIVDDQPENVQLMAGVLATNGYLTLAAHSGREALEILKTQPADAVLLDMLMPGMDGFEVMHRIRENPKTAGIPILVITAMWISDEDRTRIQREAQGILQKGTFWIEELLKEVARVLGAGSAAR